MHERLYDDLVDRLEKSELKRSKLEHKMTANGETVFHIRILPPSQAEVDSTNKEIGFLAEQLSRDGDETAAKDELSRRLATFLNQKGDRILFVTENESTTGLAFGVYDLESPDDFDTKPDGTYSIHAKGMIDGSFGDNAPVPRRWRHLVHLRAENANAADQGRRGATVAGAQAAALTDSEQV